MTRSENTLLILAKDVLFIALGCFLIVRTPFLGKVLGALAVIWYGRDLWYRGKNWLGTGTSGRDTVKRSKETPREGNAPAGDGKIQVTDLSGAKEVDFEKE